MKQPVTIGGQTFEFNPGKGGWIDRKTKAAADKSLIALLDSVSQDIPNSFENLRSKIDKSVDPVIIGGDKYIFDTNRGWVSEKGKIPVPEHMQKLLNEAVGQKPATAFKEEAPKIVKSAGIVGELVWAGARWVDPKTGKYVSAKDAAERGFETPKGPTTQKPKKKEQTRQEKEQERAPKEKTGNAAKDAATPVNKEGISKINPQIADMVGHLFAINDNLQQKLDADIKQAKIGRLKSRESIIKSRMNAANDNQPRTDVDLGDEDKGLSPFIIAGAVGLIAAAFTPLKDIMKSMYEAVVPFVGGIGDYFSEVEVGLDYANSLMDNSLVQKMREMNLLMDRYIEGNNGKPQSKSPSNNKTETATPVAPPPNTSQMAPASTSTNSGGSAPSQPQSKSPSSKTETATQKVSAPTVSGSKSNFTDPLDVMRKTSEYGEKRGSKRHEAIDYGAPIGTPIKSVKAGRVVAVKSYKDGDGGGNRVYIDHGDGIQSWYMHMDKMQVKVGQEVQQGQQIGTVGNTGRSSGPHLHLEIRKNGKKINPETYLKGDKSATIVASHDHDHSSEGVMGKLKDAGQMGYEGMKEMVKQIIAGASKITTFDTDYKPFRPVAGSKDKTINEAAIDTHKKEVVSRTPKIVSSTPIDMPNLNKGGGTVRTAATSKDNDTIKQYLYYFDLV